MSDGNFHQLWDAATMKWVCISIRLRMNNYILMFIQRL